MRFETSTPGNMDMLFDSTAEEYNHIVEHILPAHSSDGKIEKIDVLPDWAKKFLRASSNSSSSYGNSFNRNGGGGDRYGRPAYAGKRDGQRTEGYGN